MPLFALGPCRPSISPSAWLAPTAQIIGAVVLGDAVSVWFNAVLRGDTDTIHIGAGTNIQDGSVLHCDPGAPLQIGAGVTVGHMAMLHGCTVGDGSLIGIGAIVLNHARIGKNCLVAAGSLVPEGKEYPDNSLIMGSPAKVVRTLDDAAIAAMQRNAANYEKNCSRYAAELRPVSLDDAGTNPAARPADDH